MRTLQIRPADFIAFNHISGDSVYFEFNYNGQVATFMTPEMSSLCELALGVLSGKNWLEIHIEDDGIKTFAHFKDVDGEVQNMTPVSSDLVALIDGFTMHRNNFSSAVELYNDSLEEAQSE